MKRIDKGVTIVDNFHLSQVGCSSQISFGGWIQTYAPNLAIGIIKGMDKDQSGKSAWHYISIPIS